MKDYRATQRHCRESIPAGHLYACRIARCHCLSINDASARAF